MIRRPPRSTLDRSSAASDVYKRQVQILYYTPTGAQLGGLAIIGGTGMLENYGTDKAVNDDIHERNIAVCQSIKRGYEAYADGYIKKVKATHNEDQLRKLGPPRSPYQ